MASSSSFFLLLLICFLASAAASMVREEEDLSTYIVHAHTDEAASSFLSTIASVKGLQLNVVAEQHKAMYTYDTVARGFTTKLSKSQAAMIEAMDDYVVFPDKAVELHTTHTPSFLKLTTTSGLWPVSDFGDDIVIGVLDTGIWPDRPSFSDHRLQDVPAWWKGKCEAGPGFPASFCNKKIIGARAFYKGYEAAHGPMNETIEHKSPLDDEGHGTHTASTAAGHYVFNASFMGEYAFGTARGIAPRARIAVYKVCWKKGCFSSDILAAIESAVQDGVHIISMSLGDSFAVPYYQDTTAIGAFGAMEKGVLVSCSAGNSGPTPVNVSNTAPWILTVAASTVDREFPSPVILGNGASYIGSSIYSGKDLGGEQLPLIYGANAAMNGNSSAHLCLPGTLDPKLVSNKIVVCDKGINPRVEKGAVVQEAGGAGLILANTQDDGELLIADAFTLPATHVGFKEGEAIKAYINNIMNSTATIEFKGTELGTRPAPVIAAFSSRGPNALAPQILKPDITAPGVNILAAWTGAVGPSGLEGDTRDVDFNIISGTSMSCPHVSGLSALLKAAHPDWSPAAIKSAIMTTAARVEKDRNDYSTEVFAYTAFGAGHVNPEAALDPGLVYDLAPEDYVWDFLCGLNYTEKYLRMFTKGKYNCSGGNANLSGLNYPSFSIVFNQGVASSYETRVIRTATNVGDARSDYTVYVDAPPGVDVKVEPQTLSFTEKKQKLSYRATFKASSLPYLVENTQFVMPFGSLFWTDGAHIVKSPISFMWSHGGSLLKL